MLREPAAITEIVGRAEAGISVKPFRCLIAGEKLVYLKPLGTNPMSLISEWTGSQIGDALGVPTADFGLAQVPADLVNAYPSEDRVEMKPGTGFVSYKSGPWVRDIEFADLEVVPTEDLAALFVFDQWIGNPDRTLTMLGGNPNLVFDPSHQEFFAIDHDSAFDPESGTVDTLTLHPGLAAARAEFGSPERRTAWLRNARKVLAELDRYWESIPDEWIIAVDEGGQDPELIREMVTRKLRIPFEDNGGFWTRILTTTP